MVFLIVIVTVVGLLIRRAWRSAGRFRPANPPPAPRTACFVEALVLAAAATIIIAITACWPNTNGYMLMLDQLSPAYAAFNVAVFAVAVAGAAVAVGMTLTGRTLAGGIVMTVVLSAYGLTLNGMSYPGEWFLPRSITEPVAEYVIVPTGPNVDGAELWVNGVLLGKAPYKTTPEEFKAKVPYWPEPPADYKTDKADVPRYSLWGGTTDFHYRWIKFELPNPPEPGGRSPESRPPRPVYYARVRYAGEWALAAGGSGSGSSGGGRGPVRMHSTFDVILPERQRRLDTLLTKARLADYRVGPDWFRAIETYDNDGWIAVRQAGDTEPAMMGLLDEWVRWHYGLDKPLDAEAAWAALERIGDEVDRRGEYLTSSLAGRAVELLTPMLPRERLVDRAVELIRCSGSVSLVKWEMNGRLQFGFKERPGGSIGSGGGYSMHSGGGWWGSAAFPGDGFPIAHAVWMLHEEILRRHEPSPNLIQRRIVPELVRSWGDKWLIDLMLVAAHFGGEDIDRFLLRQKWGDKPSPGWNDRVSLGGGNDTNKWLYLLAHLNDEAGRTFRREHAGAVMEMADSVFKGSGRLWMNGKPGFLFADPDLALRYWPRFDQLAGSARRNFDEPLTARWRYLAELGPAATGAMFVEAWRHSDPDLMDYDGAMSALDGVPEPLRQG
ncbi:MAG: hypothetical protein NT031_13890, partial [Planctomycetota bacterium]|nr:hypothetical protein [Planctomycetota bacterium]